MAVDLAIMLIVAILCAENGRANRARKVFDMVFAVECSYVRSTKCPATVKAQKVESSKVVRLAERELS